MGKDKKSKKDGSNGTGVSKTPKNVSEERTTAIKPFITKTSVKETQDFPRGGATGLTPLEFRDISEQAKKEVLFSDGTESKSKKRKMKDVAPKATKKAKSKSKNAEKPERSTENGEDQIHIITFKKMAKDSLVFGRVAAINDLDLTISLPNHLVGFVPITAISKEFSEIVAKEAEEDSDDEDAMSTEEDEDRLDLKKYFYIGQFVKCVITDVEEESSKKRKKKILLSLVPESINERLLSSDLSVGMVMSVSVKSIEDHGYVLSTGIENVVSGFLPHKEAKAYLDSHFPGSKQLRVGQVLEVNITSVSEDKRTIKTSANPAYVQKAMLKDPLSSIGSLQPGQLIESTITGVYDTGLTIRILSFFSGSIEILHLQDQGLSGLSDIQKVYKEGQKITVRILYVSLTTAAKIITATCVPHIIALEAQHLVAEFENEGNGRVNGWPIPYGAQISDAVVKRVDPKVGLVLQVPKAKSLFAAVHISRVSDKKDISISASSGRYKLGSTHKCRVVGYDALDGVIQATMQKSVVEEQYLKADDLTVGEVITGTVERVLESGMIVKISGHIKGFVPKEHLSDVKLSDPTKKFKENNSVKCRVWSIRPEDNKVLLTCKRTIVNSSLPIISGYSEEDGAIVGECGMGVVSNFVKGGVLITMFQNKKAFVPMGEISDAYVSDPREVLKESQAVKFRVLSVDGDSDRMRVSLRLSSVRSGDTANEAKPKPVSFSQDADQLQVGQVVSGTVVKVSNQRIVVSLEPSNVQGILDIPHLSDHAESLPEKILEKLSVGHKFEKLVIIRKIESFSGVAVSAKPALIKAAIAKKIPSELSQAEPGKTFVGYVHNVSTFGVFVNFLGGLVGMAPISALSEHYVSSPDELFQKDQTVVAFVTKVDKESGRIELSLKTSLASVGDTGCLNDEDFITEYFSPAAISADSDDKSNESASIISRVGHHDNIVIKNRMPYGWMAEPATGDKSVFAWPEKTTGFITLEQTKGFDKDSDAASQSNALACILDIDAEKNIIDYSIRPELVSARKNALLNGKNQKKRKKGQEKAAKHNQNIIDLCKKKSTVEATIELVKQDYMVLSIPSCGHAIGFASTKSYNLRSKPFIRYKVGQTLRGQIAYVPNSIDEKNTNDKIGRLLMVIKSSDNTLKEAILSGKRAANNPVDPSIQFFEDYQPGIITKARIKSIKGAQANLDLADNIKGRLHISEIVDSIKDFSSSSDPILEPFKTLGLKAGSEITVKVIGWHDAKTHRFLPITHRVSPNKAVINVSIQPSELKEPGKVVNETRRSIKAGDLKEGQIMTGFVSSANEKEGVWVYLTSFLRGRIMPFKISRSYQILSKIGKHFPIGATVEVKVESVNPEKGSVDLLLVDKTRYPEPILSIEQLVEGETVFGKVISADKNKTVLMVQVGQEVKSVKNDDNEDDGLFNGPKYIRGRVALTDIADEYKSSPLDGFKAHQLVAVNVAHVNKEQGHIDLSLRPSLTKLVDYLPRVVDPNFKHSSELSVDQVVRGYIKSVSTKGCFVQLSRYLTARIKISELSDDFIRDINSVFKPGQLVTAKVINVDKERDQVELSMKKSVLGEVVDGKKLKRIDEILVGETFKGTVSRTENYGVLIKLDDSYVTGLCPVSEIADDEEQVDPHKIYEKGDRVMVKVLEVDTEKKRAKLGLKTSYFTPDELDEDSDQESDQSEEDNEAEASESSDNSDDDDDEEEESSDSEEATKPAKINPHKKIKLSALPVDSGFQWDDDSDDELMAVNDDQSESDSSSGEDEKENAEKKKSKKKKSKNEPTKDVTAEVLEEAPKSAADFERLLVGSPNSSYLWINYMAFYLQLSEVDHARSIARRALKTISFREEQEKLNVWVALLNLEHRFGSQDSLNEVFKESTEYMDAKQMYVKLAKIYERSQKFKEAEDTYKTLIRKFGESSDVWIQFGLYYLKRSTSSTGVKARELLQRALKSLPKHEHVKTITQFAQMEFQYGEPERGRTIFEGVLSSYPKRNDIWLIYINMEINLVTKQSEGVSADSKKPRGDGLATARNLFQRVTAMKLSSKKIKSLFKQWLQFEKKHGSEEDIEEVKSRALEYVQSQQ